MGWVLFLQIILLIIVIYLAVHALIEQYFKMQTTNAVTTAQIKKDHKLL
jgi:hypothetical protein